MNIEKQTAVMFLVALGFKTAEEWDTEKIQQRMAEVPSRLTLDAVPDKMHDLYNALAKAVKEGEEIVIEVEKGEVKKEKKQKETKATKTPAVKKEKKEKPAKKEKKAKAVKKEKKERDEFGSLVGSLRGKINAVLTKDYQTDEDIAKAAGVTVRKARGYCRDLTRAGALEKLRTIAFRLVPVKKAS